MLPAFIQVCPTTEKHYRPTVYSKPTVFKKVNKCYEDIGLRYIYINFL